VSRRPPLILDKPARITLEQMRDHHPKAYMRERAAALLKIAGGMAPAAVARVGLLKRRDPDTVYSWLDRYLEYGICGLQLKPGRGRKPAFFPKEAEIAATEVEMVLHQSPRQYGVKQTRWRLQDVGRALNWLEGLSEPGIYKVLKRLGFSRKQALNFIHSPDPEYRYKWQRILAAYNEAVTHPETVVMLFQDELTYYRQPSKARAWHGRGQSQPLARQAPRANTKTRLAGVLNAITGQVHYLQRSKIGNDALVEFYTQIQTAYPEAEVIYLVQDNWPVHKTETVLTAATENNLQLLFLPTYASWLNPIEKLWRWLKQEVLHLHRYAAVEKLSTLRAQVTGFLDQFANGSRLLLHYVGIMPIYEPDLTTELNC
jgi:transposase